MSYSVDLFSSPWIQSIPNFYWHCFLKVSRVSPSFHSPSEHSDPRLASPDYQRDYNRLLIQDCSPIRSCIYLFWVQIWPATPLLQTLPSLPHSKQNKNHTPLHGLQDPTRTESCLHLQPSLALCAPCSPVTPPSLSAQAKASCFLFFFGSGSFAHMNSVAESLLQGLNLHENSSRKRGII